jgi:hypothetical protein
MTMIPPGAAGVCPLCRGARRVMMPGEAGAALRPCPMCALPGGAHWAPPGETAPCEKRVEMDREIAAGIARDRQMVDALTLGSLTAWLAAEGNAGGALTDDVRKACDTLAQRLAAAVLEGRERKPAPAADAPGG